MTSAAIVARRAQNEVRRLDASERRSGVMSALRAWLSSDARSAVLTCPDGGARAALAYATMNIARRQRFRAVIAPLGPDMWWLPDVGPLVGGPLDFEVPRSPTDLSRNIEYALADADAPLLVVLDGVDDADPSMPWRRWMANLSASVKLLIASSVRIDSQASCVIDHESETLEPDPPADIELVGLLSTAVASLTIDELTALLGRVPKRDDRWIHVDDHGWRLWRCRRPDAARRIKTSARREFDRRLAETAGHYGERAAIHLGRAGASIRHLRRALDVSTFSATVQTATANHVRNVAMERVRAKPSDAVLALSVEAALREAYWNSSAARASRDIESYWPLTRACLGLALDARGEPKKQLLDLAAKAASHIDAPHDRADAFIRIARALGRGAKARSFANRAEQSLHGLGEMPLWLARELGAAATLHAVTRELATAPTEELASVLANAPRRVIDDIEPRLASLPEQRRYALLAAIGQARGRVAPEVVSAVTEHAMESGQSLSLVRVVPLLSRTQVQSLAREAHQLPAAVRSAVARRLIALGDAPLEASAIIADAVDRAVVLADALGDALPVGVVMDWLAALDSATMAMVLPHLATPLARQNRGEDALALDSRAPVALAVLGGGQRLPLHCESALVATALERRGTLLRDVVRQSPRLSTPAVHLVYQATLDELATELRGAALAGDNVCVAITAPLWNRLGTRATSVAIARAALRTVGTSFHAPA